MFNNDPFKNYPQPIKPPEWKSPTSDAHELRNLRKDIADYIKVCRNLGYSDVANDLQMILDE